MLRSVGTERLIRKESAFGGNPLRFEQLFERLFHFRLQALKELNRDEKTKQATDLSDVNQANLINGGLFRNTVGGSGGGTRGCRSGRMRRRSRGDSSGRRTARGSVRRRRARAW